MFVATKNQSVTISLQNEAAVFALRYSRRPKHYSVDNGFVFAHRIRASHLGLWARKREISVSVKRADPA